MMRTFNVGSTRMPALELKHNEGHVAKFVPFALWVLSTNGRVDFKFNGQRREIFDMADSFEPPVWRTSLAFDWRTREAVGEKWLGKVLR